MYGYKKKKGKKKERSQTSLNSLARNARTFRKLSLSVRRIWSSFFISPILFVKLRFAPTADKVENNADYQRRESRESIAQPKAHMLHI